MEVRRALDTARTNPGEFNAHVLLNEVNESVRACLLIALKRRQSNVAHTTLERPGQLPQEVGSPQELERIATVWATYATSAGSEFADPVRRQAAIDADLEPLQIERDEASRIYRLLLLCLEENQS